MRVEGIAVYRLESGQQWAELRTHRRRPGPGGIHVDPGTGFSSHCGNSWNRVDGPRRGRADRSRHETGHQTGVSVRGHHRGERPGVHGEIVPHLDHPQCLVTEAGDPDALLDRGVGLAGGVSHQPGQCRSPSGTVPGGK